LNNYVEDINKKNELSFVDDRLVENDNKSEFNRSFVSNNSITSLKSINSKKSDDSVFKKANIEYTKGLRNRDNDISILNSVQSINDINKNDNNTNRELLSTTNVNKDKKKFFSSNIDRSNNEMKF